MIINRFKVAKSITGSATEALDVIADDFIEKMLTSDDKDDLAYMLKSFYNGDGVIDRIGFSIGFKSVLDAYGIPVCRRLRFFKIVVEKIKKLLKK